MYTEFSCDGCEFCKVAEKNIKFLPQKIVHMSLEILKT